MTKKMNKLFRWFASAYQTSKSMRGSLELLDVDRITESQNSDKMYDAIIIINRFFLRQIFSR